MTTFSHLPDPARLRELAGRIPARRIALIGDIAADVYLVGKTHRISREAPVLIIRQNEEFVVPGQAANAAANAVSLGGEVDLVGMIGTDRQGQDLLQALRLKGIRTDSILEIDSLKTSTKTRILAGQQHTRRQQVVRIDRDDETDVAASVHEDLRERASAAISQSEACVVSDYGYQAIALQTWEAILKACRDRGIPLLLDSRRRLGILKGADVITPNEEEALELAGCEDTLQQPSHHVVLDHVLARSEARAVIYTRGNEGMVLGWNAPDPDCPLTMCAQGTPPVTFGVNGSDEAVDVSGAGDTVVATVALALAAGGTLVEAAHLANIAAGISVGKVGAACVSSAELAEALNDWPTKLKPQEH